MVQLYLTLLLESRRELMILCDVVKPYFLQFSVGISRVVTDIKMDLE